jgi:hypothetical protein
MKYVHIEKGRIVEIVGKTSCGNFLKVMNLKNGKVRQYGFTAFELQYKPLEEGK